MTQVNIPSFRALAQQAQVSSWQIRQLRQGQVEHMRFGILLNISRALQISVDTLIKQCSTVSIASFDQTSQANRQEPSHQEPSHQETSHQHQPPSDLLTEYQRLQAQLEHQRETLQQDFQRTSLHVIESWMTYWPAAVYATQSNPELPATRLIPLVRPVEKLLEQWGVEAIASVGTEVPYDPQYHQLIEGQANPGDRVKISNPGYFHGKTLLQRAKVKPIQTQE